MLKKVVKTAAFPYSAQPTWSLQLDCGHVVQFSSDAGDTQTKPPSTVNCPECSKKEGIKTMKVQTGDVIKFQSVVLICYSFNDSGSRWMDMSAGVVEVREGEHRSTKEFVRLSGDLEEGFILEHRGEQGLKDFLAANISRSQKQTTETGDSESNEVMATKSKTKKNAGAKAGAKSSEVSYKGRSELIRKLKKDGLSFADAYAKVKDKFAGSSEVNVKKVWDKKEKTPKAEAGK